MGLVEGVLTDLKIMMDAAPFISGNSQNERPSMQEFEPSPEYLNAISGPFPLKEDEVEEVSSEDEYKQAMSTPSMGSETPYKSLQIDELAGVPVTATNAISVTKLSPDLDSMTLKELQTLAKQNGLTIAAGSRRKAIIDMLKGNDTNTTSLQGTMISEVSGPEPVGGSALE
uniref:Rho termination factor N-terminal domain-containing protein n=1 Tax=viral metagenome TaxID=1070528 RepID=A0A6C0DJD1_9ZZZZ